MNNFNFRKKLPKKSWKKRGNLEKKKQKNSRKIMKKK